MNRQEPLGLPRGSVRALITILLVVIVGLIVFFGAKDSEARTALIALAGIAVRDYFASRKEQNEQAGPPLEPPATFED